MQHDTTDKAEGIALFDSIAEALVAVVIARLSSRLDETSKRLACLEEQVRQLWVSVETLGAEKGDTDTPALAGLNRALKELTERVDIMQDEMERLEREIDDKPDEDRLERLERDLDGKQDADSFEDAVHDVAQEAGFVTQDQIDKFVRRAVDTALEDANLPDVARVERIAREAAQDLANRLAEALTGTAKI